jgi:hypothetical protein
MAHPYHAHRQQHLEKSRVHSLCRGGYAKGGAVHGDEKEDKALIKKEVKADALKDKGKKAKRRGDKPCRAKGGRIKKAGHGKTNVNVIVAPNKGNDAPVAGLAPHPPMPPPAAAAPPPMPAGPPPGAPPMGAKPPMGAPPMPMRKRGGAVEATDGLHPPGAKTNTLAGPSTDQKGTIRTAEKNAHAAGHSAKHLKLYAKGGKVNAGANERGKTGIGFRLPVQHSGNKDDTQNIGRKDVITKAKGGKVDKEKRGGEKMYSWAQHNEAHPDGEGDVGAKGRKQYGDGIKVHAHPTMERAHNRATGGPIYADGREGVGMGPDLKAGANSGLGRMRKQKEESKYNRV